MSTRTTLPGVGDVSAPAAVTGLVLALLLANALFARPGLFVDQLVGGLVYGLILVLLALGLSIILGLLGVVNFAHGALFMGGAYLTYQVVAAWGLSFWAALLVVPYCDSSTTRTRSSACSPRSGWRSC
jgi:branched-chain amino acid transport system permease protein